MCGHLGVSLLNFHVLLGGPPRPRTGHMLPVGAVCTLVPVHPFVHARLLDVPEEHIRSRLCSLYVL